MDCFVACAPLRKRFAFVAGNDEEMDIDEAMDIAPFSRPLHFISASASARNAWREPSRE
jgi:hypothetical protein